MLAQALPCSFLLCHVKIQPSFACMHACRQYRFPVRQHLKEGTSEVTVVVQSAVSEAAARAAAYPYPVPFVQVSASVCTYLFMHASVVV